MFKRPIDLPSIFLRSHASRVAERWPVGLPEQRAKYCGGGTDSSLPLGQANSKNSKQLFSPKIA